MAKTKKNKEISFKKKILSLEESIANYRSENLKLEIHLNDYIRKLNELLSQARNKGWNDAERYYNKDMNKIFAEGRKKESDIIIDEFAHTIRHDVNAAVKKLNNPNEMERAKYFLQNIEDLINGLFWHLKFNDRDVGDDYVSINLYQELIQLKDDMLEIIDTLGINEEFLKNFINHIPQIPLISVKNPVVILQKEFKVPLIIIFRDLLINAIRNTDVQNPQVSIEIKEESFHYQVIFKNNTLIEPKYQSFINSDSEDQNPTIATETKIGLKLVKKLKKDIGVDVFVTTQKRENTTSTIITIQKELLCGKC